MYVLEWRTVSALTILCLLPELWKMTVIGKGHAIDYLINKLMYTSISL